jgi:CheY-like chemotaxis protein
VDAITLSQVAGQKNRDGPSMRAKLVTIQKNSSALETILPRAGQSSVSRFLPFHRSNSTIDDEQIVVQSGTAILERLGYTVTPATNSLRALEIFRFRPGEFDMIITDYTMPKLTWTDLFTYIRRIRPDIQIILCTGFSEKITATVALDPGVEFVMKPFSMRQKAELVRKVLRVQES